VGWEGVLFGDGGLGGGDPVVSGGGGGCRSCSRGGRRLVRGALAGRGVWAVVGGVGAEGGCGFFAGLA